MPRPSTVMIAATSVLGAGLLTACEAPPPGISVWSGTTSVRTEALCWAFDSPSLEPGQCAEEIVQGTNLGDIEELAVIPGDVFGVSVDPVIAESGWTVRIGNEPLNPAPLTTTYFRFQIPQNAALPAEGIALQVVAGQDTQIRGVWATRLLQGS